MLWFLGVCGSSAAAQGSGAIDPLQGPQRLEVADLELRGVRALDESELRAVLQTQESSWLPWRDRKYFDAGVFEDDLKRIVTFYAERGYPHARVVESIIDTRDGKVSLRIDIEEGQPLRVANVTFSGFDVVAPSRVRALEQAAPLRPGEPLSLEDVRATARMAVNILGDAGYAYAQVEARQVMVEPDAVHVEIHAAPGSRGTFGPVQIAGNATVSDRVIRRELAYLPGQPFRASALRESQRRLVALGLFESVLVEVAAPDRPKPDVPTRVSVKEADLNQFGYEFGYGTEEQLSVEASWRHLNAFGGGRTATLRGRWSSIDRGGEGLFRYPYLFTAGLSLQVSGYAWHVDEPVFTLWSRGGSSSLNYQFGSTNQFTTTYLHQFESSRVDAAALSSGLLTTLGLDAADGTRDGLLTAVLFDARRDTTNHAVNPRAGHRLFVRIETAGGWLPGSFSYRQLFATARHYRALGPLIAAGQVQFGSIVAETEADVPFSRRYFLGGADTLRGWGRLEVSPLSPEGSPIGGRTVMTLNGELRFPVAGRLSGVTFVDAGNVWSAAWDVHPADLRSDAGAGLRLDSPFGLLRLDLAYQLTPIAGLRIDDELLDRRWRVHVSVGQGF